MGMKRAHTCLKRDEVVKLIGTGRGFLLGGISHIIQLAVGVCRGKQTHGITEREICTSGQGWLWETRQRRDRRSCVHAPVSSALRKGLCSRASHPHQGCKAMPAEASPCHKSNGAGSWIHSLPSMPSIPSPGFSPFPLPGGFSALWAGNARGVCVCVTAQRHGNGGEGGLRLLPPPHASGAPARAQ